MCRHGQERGVRGASGTAQASSDASGERCTGDPAFPSLSVTILATCMGVQAYTVVSLFPYLGVMVELIRGLESVNESGMNVNCNLRWCTSDTWVREKCSSVFDDQLRFWIVGQTNSEVQDDRRPRKCAEHFEHKALRGTNSSQTLGDRDVKSRRVKHSLPTDRASFG